MRELVLDKDNLEIVNLFKKIKRFDVFPEQELLTFIKMGVLQEYEPNEIIIRQGNNDRWVYFLITGSLDIVKTGQVVATLKRCGDLFGEMGAIDGSPRSATIRANSKSLVAGFDSTAIDPRTKSNHLSFSYTLYRIFAEVLAVRLRETTKENMRLKRMVQPFLEPAAQARKDRKKPPENLLQNKKVLLVDNDMQARKILRSILQELKFQEVIETRDKTQALKILSEEKVDLILAELNLPRGEGLKLLEKIRSQPKTKNIPYIIITGETDQNKISQAVQAKVTHYLVKPITPKVLFEKIKDSLDA